MNFKSMVHAAAQLFSGRVLNISEICGNFIFAEIEMQSHNKENFYILKSLDEQWAISEPIEKNSCDITFINIDVVSEQFRNLFGIETLSAETLNSQFKRLDFMDKSWNNDLAYWKPKTLGEALFNWWD